MSVRSGRDETRRTILRYYVLFAKGDGVINTFRFFVSSRFRIIKYNTRDTFYRRIRNRVYNINDIIVPSYNYTDLLMETKPFFKPIGNVITWF